MASTTTVFLLLFATVIALSTVTTTTARPCKTIFFITSSSHHNNNNNNNNINNPPRLTFFITEIRDIPRTTSFPRPMLLNHSSSLPLSSLLSSLSSLLWLSNDVGTSEQPYIATSSTVKASIRGRTMDVMSIVGAVIFGVGCGAITAVTMYLFWSLFAPRRFEFCSDSESGDDDDEEEDERVDEDDHEGCFGVPVVAKAVPPSADEVDRIAGMK